MKFNYLLIMSLVATLAMPAFGFAKSYNVVVGDP